MTAEEIFRWAGEARRGNRAYVSNAYYTVGQLKTFMEEKDVRVIADEDVILLLERDDGLYRLQFFARSLEALKTLPQLLPPLDQPLVTDFVGREPAVGSQAEQLCTMGFAPCSVFVRMVCKQHQMPRSDGTERVETACSEDAEAVHEMIAAAFDPLFAHIPSVEDLAQAIEKGEIRVIRAEGKLAAMAYFEKESEKYYVLRYFIVDPGFRGQNLAGALMYDRFSSAPEDTVYMLWVGTYNNAQSLYLKFGFQYDGLTDHILLFGGKENGKNL